MSELREALEHAMSGKEVENVVTEENSTIDRPDTGMMGDEGKEADAPQAKEDGRVELGDENPEEKPKAEATDDKDSGEPPAEKQGDVKSDKTNDKPPVGWTPENREQWAKLPDAVRKQISKREVEVNKLLQDTSNARKFSSDFYQTIDPYKAMMVAEGATTPIHAVQNLLQTAATLKMGNKAQKAERMAQLIRHYDIDISELDNVLSTAPQRQQQQAPDINQQVEQLVNQRMAPYEQQQRQQTQQRASQALQRVQGAEFFNDVRNDMADLIEVATKNGRQMTAEDAYRKAVHMNPEVQNVLRQRQANGIQQKKLAASSVNGKRGGVADNTGDQSLRDMIEANWSSSARG